MRIASSLLSDKYLSFREYIEISRLIISSRDQNCISWQVWKRTDKTTNK